MKTVFARYRKAMTVLGAVLLIWSAMQSDGGAPLALVAPTAGAAVALLLWGRLLTPKPVKKQEKTPCPPGMKIALQKYLIKGLDKIPLQRYNALNR